MHTRLASFLLVTSAVILSFVSFIAGEVVVPLYHIRYREAPPAVALRFMPAPARFVSDHRSLVVVLLAAVCLVSLATLWRLPAQTLRCLVAGLCIQWLLVWAAAFCLCYDGFLGDVSMHHPERFRFDHFFFLAGGVFPVSFVLIVVPLLISLWPIFRRTRPA